ncbi:MAG: hypothetical protein CFH19_00595 [Alphaproteobacteria bacterium MarineAlpha5_Bin9]|nr:MAG: hypothetical protein CFH19_00595 [Alphaproteobacteria bacterium MarineAlpha5_Bin9]|tara:strand:+ start:5479 stop:6309 length:831 start_codon:yes stop_codon:yes gene_type:complete
MVQNNLAFTFASTEVSPLGRAIIKITELSTGKLKLKKLYDQYLNENRPPELFWHDAVDKLKIKIDLHFLEKDPIPKTGRLIIVANHAFGVADGVIMGYLLTKVRQDYKLITHKVLRQAEAIKEKIIPFDFEKNKEALKNNIQSRKDAERVLLNEGVIMIFPSGAIATKNKIKKNIKAIESDWKMFTAKLALKTKSPVLPIFFEGQNSDLFHIANKMGQTFRYSLMMYELKRKIGETIGVHVGQLIKFDEIESIGDIKEITFYLRKKTYELDPESSS